VIEKHVPAEGVAEERLTPEQVLTAAYVELRPESLTGMDFMGLSDDTKRQILHDVFADAWAEPESLTDVRTTVERLRKEVYEGARKARRQSKKKDKVEYLSSSQELFEYYAWKASNSDDRVLDPPEARELTPEDIRHFWEIVRTVLRGRQITVMEMFYGQKLTPEQIGSRLGMTSGAVRHHKARAHATLERAKDKFTRFRLPPDAGEPQEGEGDSE
jgi:DNA-directed RNA polymerase specialized sigma24 family protein